MTPAQRSIQETVDEHLTMALYASIALACVAFAGMLLAPDEHAELLLSVAWVCMAGSIVCLASRLVLNVVAERPQEGAIGWRTPQQ